ncbi:hypothetical protein ES705_24414 [subsurface metagenome]
MKESEMFRANKILEANKSKLEMKKKRTEKKKTILPCGNITLRKDIFKFKSENIGIFPKPKIERKDNIK